MDDGIGTKNTQLLWIHWSNHVISFHEESGYERLEFPTCEKKWNMFLERLPMVFASNNKPSAKALAFLKRESTATPVAVASRFYLLAWKLLS